MGERDSPARRAPFVSVVVCTYNRCRMLDLMLASFYEQVGLCDVSHELIVVDNNSSDETLRIAQRYSHHPGFRYVFETRQGLSAARNRGVREACGEVVAFLDDDVLVGSAWLVNLGRCFDETQATAVGGRASLHLEAEAPPWMGPLFRALLSEVELGTNRLEVPTGEGLWGLNLAIRRQALLEIGGFDEELGRRGASLLGGEECDVLARLARRNGRFFYEPLAPVRHVIGPERLGWDYFVRLARAAGAVRHRGEPDRGVGWQLLRVGRSGLGLVHPRMHVALLRAIARDEYRTHLIWWHHAVKREYHRLRWQRLMRHIRRASAAG